MNFSFVIFIEGMCVVALAPCVMTINGSIFHPLLIMLSISDWYFSILVAIVSGENLSLQSINSMNCISKFFSRATSGFDWYNNPLIHIKCGLNLAL